MFYAAVYKTSKTLTQGLTSYMQSLDGFVKRVNVGETLDT